MIDHFFWVIIYAIAFLFIVAIVLMVVVISLWGINRFRDHRWEIVKNKWQKQIYNSIMESRPDQVRLMDVPSGDVLDFVDFLLELSRKLQGDARESLSKLAKPHLRIVSRKTTSSSPDRRAWACRVLGSFGLPEYENHLLRLLKDPSLTVRMIAFQGLVYKGTPGILDNLLDSLPSFRRWNTTVLAQMLTQLGPQSVQVLRSRFSNPKTPESARTVLAIALKNMNDVHSAPIAAQILSTEKSKDLLAACLRLMEAVGTKDHLPIIRPFCRSSDFALRALAATALGRLGDESDKKALRTAIEDPSPWVALHAGWALKKISAINILNDIAHSSHPRSDLAKQVLMEGQE